MREFKKQISDSEIRKLPLLEFQGEIHVISTLKEIKEVMPIILNSKVLGFDTETRPAFKKGEKHKVALLQLATISEVFLFRLNKTGLSQELIDILANEDITKVGAAITDDLRGLKKLNTFKPGGFVELQTKIKEYYIEQISLKKMTAIVLQGRISKSQQTSNWENKRLSKAQLAYAATDAWCCLKIYNTLENHI